MTDASSLDQLRARIDQLDGQLIDLLNARAKVVVEIGAIKRSKGGAIYAPHREAEVLCRVLGKNQGPLPDRCIERIYRELMSGSFALERPLRIGYLGPKGSPAHVAARSQFGASVAYENLHSVRGIFTEVQRGHVDYGLVPVEHPAAGPVRDTIDGFLQSQDSVYAYAEVMASLRYHLFARCSPKEVEVIYASPQDLDRCAQWVRTQYPRAQVVQTPNAADAVQKACLALQSGQGGAAAIASRLAVEGEDLPLLFESIEDDPNQCLRFLVVSKERALVSGDDKTAMLLRVPAHAGSLATVLSLLAQYEVELTHIERLASASGSAVLLEVLGHRQSEPLEGVLTQLAPLCEELRILGSFPRAQRLH